MYAINKKEALQKAKVTGEILSSNKSQKVIIYKYKKRKNSNKKNGHRQKFMRVKITKIAVA
ncbi:50S ribosomal protein L21 [Candidatus Desantisbacteria bacterium]|nr:50S ribosomal protein L21 [Candidatus Desantisbacteria bacterium]